MENTTEITVKLDHNFNRGKFIVLDGIDGSGKSTQMELLSKYFIKHKLDIYITREPTRDIKDYTLESFIEDRRHHYYHYILPTLQTGITILCDRYKLSTNVYQFLQGNDLEEITKLNDFPDPDLTIILDCDVNISFNRNKKEDDFDKDLEFQKKARKLYLNYENSPGIYIIDVSEKTKEEVHEMIINILHTNLYL